MIIQELLKKLADYLNLGAKKRSKGVKDLKLILKALKYKEQKLIAKCRDQPTGNKRKMLKRKIAVLNVKRKKGLKALKKLIRT